MELILDEFVVRDAVSTRLEMVQEFDNELSPFQVRLLENVAVFLNFKEVFELVQEINEQVIDVDCLLGRVWKFINEPEILI